MEVTLTQNAGDSEAQYDGHGSLSHNDGALQVPLNNARTAATESLLIRITATCDVITPL
jgi:hypothetical protein